MNVSALDALRVENNGTPTPTQKGSVDKDSFLNLLVTQLRNQDPLEPVQNSEFIAQLAQFQSLESQLTMGERLEDLVGLQESQLALAGLSQAALLVGKRVTWEDDGVVKHGTIDTVTVEDGVMMVNTENGKVPVGALTSIGQGASNPNGSGGPDDPDPTTPTTPPTSNSQTLTTSDAQPPAWFKPRI